MQPSQSFSDRDAGGPRSDRRFADRTAVVTGAAQGIGRAICERLLEVGAAGIVSVDRQNHDLDDERCVALVADVSDP
jgi:dihydroxycyclohexadiene carboxylate dehydrogenase